MGVYLNSVIKIVGSIRGSICPRSLVIIYSRLFIVAHRTANAELPHTKASLMLFSEYLLFVQSFPEVS